jgi:hypothetical protein
MMNCIIDARSDVAYHMAMTTSAPRKRNPETPVKNEDSISAWRVATHRKRRPVAKSTAKTKHPLTTKALSRSNDHKDMARPPSIVSKQSNITL